MKHKAEEEVQLCDVEGCKEPSKRSISRKKVKKSTDLSLKEGGKHAHLCKDHYKKFKKETKEEREIDRLGWKSS